MPWTAAVRSGRSIVPNIRQVAARGAAWTVAGFASRLVLRFGFNLLLTRLVAPEVFGVMAIINLLIQSLHMFSDLGISQCVTHHDRGDEPRFLNTAWTLQVFRGLGLWLIAGCWPWPAAWFYDEPALAWLIPLAAVTAALDGFYSTAVFTLNRRLARGRLVLLELVPYTSVMAAAIAAIAGDRPPAPRRCGRSRGSRRSGDGVGRSGKWRSWPSKSMASYRLIRGRRHRFTLEPAAARELHSLRRLGVRQHGVRVPGGPGGPTRDRQVVRCETLGVYRVASQLAALPAQFVAALCAQLVFPLYSRLFRDGPETEAGVAGIHRTLGVLAGWLVSGLIVAGPTFIECLYRGKYQDAGRVRATPRRGRVVHHAPEHRRGGAARPRAARLMALGQVLKLIALVPLMYCGYHWYGLIGLVVGYGIGRGVPVRGDRGWRFGRSANR